MTWFAGELVGVAALLAGVFAVVLAGVNAVTLLIGIVGLLALVLARVRESRSLATAGAVLLFCELLVAAVGGLGLASSLAAATATLLAGTFAHSAVDLRETLGATPSRDLELAHVAGTVGITSGAAVVAFLSASVRLSNVSPLAVVVLLVAAATLTAALRQ